MKTTKTMKTTIAHAIMAAQALTGLAANGRCEKEGGTTAPGAKSRITVRELD